MKSFFLLFLLFPFLLHSLLGQSLTRITFSDKRFTVLKLPPASLPSMGLYLKSPSDGKTYQSFDALKTGLATQGLDLLFAMNGGMYHPGFEPVGLYVEKGKQQTALNKQDSQGNFFLKPNGVFAWNKKQSWILETSAYERQAQKSLQPLWATQSGPMLVIEGKIHPAFNSHSTSRLLRNGVGLDATGNVFWAISEEPVTFYEMASFFKNKLGCRNALFLDGTISSLYAGDPERNDHLYPLGPIIALTRPASK